MKIQSIRNGSSFKMSFIKNYLPLIIAIVALSIGIDSFVRGYSSPYYVDINRLMEGYKRTKIEKEIF
ncbi:MAG: hypothetical protein Q8J97_15825, partial [Flavobacteriaceae bacterium]|nr:hypothetical protein [Flavobacteriaceae bacterium]